MALLRGCLCRSEEDFRGLLNLENLRLFSYKEIRAATNNFDRSNKLGRGGFGTVYKGVWGDGTAFAAKVLCSESEQGIKEFLAEIESISEAKHANLVRLLGCCIQRKNRILVYEYLENNSLDHALQLQGSANGATRLTWSTRADICVGTAKGLSYLHEEHEPNIVHRDIKASNVLLDRDYRPKIGDFGLAKLFPDNATHISTGVVGTCGYLAPEYFVHGQLTKKADVYSFGVLVLEIISGRRISQTIHSDMFLVREAWVLYQQGSLLDMVDARMEDYQEEEVLRYLRVGLACTQAAPSSRPTMGQVVALLSRPVCSASFTCSEVAPR
ncbi:cold-responsive protein kinase 1-like isoform X5 [Panicum virgatum]|uniref:cold-responsive protein kinase 1-like isoform X5 n=1 Tax=Panicum virgatum TaxID=38727 RepID=UPI0019D535EF|nr:cold-responsive protein kinase 1-like isoform X5 [Panicum virgatum]